MEKVCDFIVNREKSLRLPGGFEARHDPFASSCRLVRVLRSIIQPPVLAMFDLKAHLGSRCAVGAELVRDHDAWRRHQGFQQPPHEPLRRAHVSSALNQDVENEAILVDGAP